MKKYFKKIWTENPKFRKIAGVTLIVIGLLSVITPLTPLGFLLILGMEILGIRLLVWNKLETWFKNRNDKNNQ
jgi:hypothetical protein